jgi:hypothetical protein
MAETRRAELGRRKVCINFERKVSPEQARAVILSAQWLRSKGLSSNFERQVSPEQAGAVILSTQWLRSELEQ